MAIEISHSHPHVHLECLGRSYRRILAKGGFEHGEAGLDGQDQ